MEKKILAAAPHNPEKAARVLRRYLKQERANAYLDGILTALRPDDICIDCGANIGTITTRLAETGATVHAFEPDPVAFAELEKNVAERDNVVLHNAGVGAQSGTLSLYRIDSFDDNPIGRTVSSTLVPNAGANYVDSGETVEVVDFVAFLRPLIETHGKIGVIKMDIEGLEVDILKAMIEAGLMDQVRTTLVETHARKRKGSGKTLRRFRRLAEENPSWNLNLDWI